MRRFRIFCYAIVSRAVLVLAFAATSCAPAGHDACPSCVATGCGDAYGQNGDLVHATPLLPGNYDDVQLCGSGERWFALMAPAGGAALTLTVRHPPDAVSNALVTDGVGAPGAWRTLGYASATAAGDFIPNVPVGDDTALFVVLGGDGATGGSYGIDVAAAPLDATRDCLADCDALMPFGGPTDPADPAAIAAGYYVGTAPRYSYGRRDLVMLLRYATARMRARFPTVAPVFISDLSQADAQTPGTDVGAPLHPTGTHTDGRDGDVAYYQTLADNRYRIICGDGSDSNQDGAPGKYNDGYFCTTSTNVVQRQQEALFMATVALHPRFRAMGLDETLPKQIMDAVAALVTAGEVSQAAADRLQAGLGYGAAGGWMSHHHHVHVGLHLP